MKNITAFFILLSNTLFAQDRDTLNKISGVKKIKLGISFAPEYNILSVKQRDMDQMGISKLGFSVGINANYQLNDFFAVSTSLFYERKRVGYSTKVIFEDDLDPLTGNVISYSLQSCELSYDEIHLPLQIKCNPTKKWYYIIAGLDMLYVVNGSSNSQIRYGNGQLNEFTDKPTKHFFNYGPIIGAGIEIKAKNKVCFTLEPFAKIYAKSYSFKSYNSEYSYPLSTFGLKATWWF